jgi:hypothetical protein
VAGRYWITGVQLGIIKGLGIMKGTIGQDKLIHEIESNQFISNYPTDADKERFAQLMKAAAYNPRMNFTKEELIEIEKMCDALAGRLSLDMAIIAHKASEAGIAQDKINKLFDDSLSGYDMLRTISAKAHGMQINKYSRE